jgi:hypothetical protein
VFLGKGEEEHVNLGENEEFVVGEILVCPGKVYPHPPLDDPVGEGARLPGGYDEGLR